MDPKVDQVTVDTPAIALPIPDAQLLSVLQDAETRAKSARDKENIKERSAENNKFWRGDQVDSTRLDARYQMAHVDNISFQDLEKQIKLAAGKMPDIFAAPPDQQQFNIEFAHDIQQWLRERITTNTIKRLMKNGLRKMNLDLIAVIKPRWDYTRNDFVFELLQSEDVLFAEGSKIPEDGFSVEGSDVVFHYVEEPTTVVLAKFKKKYNELVAEIGRVEKGQMPSRIKYTEAHFRWYDTQGRMNEGVCWRYGNVILDAMPEPYYDYHNKAINYFDRPRKPFILLTYLNLGKTVYETTTAFEQSKPLNRIINKRRRQITEITDRAVPKLVFAAGTITKENAQNISPSPNEGILLGDAETPIDDIRKAIFMLPATPPNPLLFQDLSDMRRRVDSMFATDGSQAAAQGDASGISKQISRESDLVTSDDIVDIVIERAVDEMVQWCMQFARLFYDDDRPPMRATNEEGDTTFTELTRQKIETDIQIFVKASTNDKTQRRADAIQMLEAKTIDPYTLMEDLDTNNPKERTKRLLLFMQAQQTNDWSKYLEAVGVDLEDDQASAEDAQRDIELLVQGGTPSLKTIPTEEYVATFIAFVNDPQGQYSQLPPQGQDKLQQFITQLKANVQKAAAEQGNQQPQAPGAQPPGQAPQDPNAPQSPLTPQAPGYAPQVAPQIAFGGGAPTTPQQQLQQQVQTPLPTGPAPMAGAAR